MEDVELSLRLKSLGRQEYLFCDARMSARRWKKKGFINSAGVIARVTKYLFMRIFKLPDTASLFYEYYGTGKKEDHR
jgi:hypothetical protein